MCRYILESVLLLAFLAPTAAGAQRAPSGDTLLVGVLDDWPPIYTMTGGGRPGGFGVEVMEEVARRAGFEVRYRRFGSFPEALEALAADRIDVIPDMGVLASREEAMGLGFTTPYETQAIRAFVRSATSEIETVEDLVDRRLAVVDYNVGVDLVGEVSTVDPVVVSDVRTAIFRLLSGEVDGLIYPEPVVRHLARAAHLEDQIRSLSPPLREVRRGMAVSPGRMDDILPRLEGALVAFRDTPEFQEIYTRWHMPPAPFFTRDRLIALFGVVLLLVLVGMAAWRHLSLLGLNRRLRDQEARFRSLAEGLAEGIVIINLEERRIAYVNQRCCEMLGYDRVELEGMRPEEIIATPEARKAVPDRLVDRLRGLEESYEVQLIRSDRSLLWVDVHASPYVLDGKVAGSLAALTDITARKEAEEELAERRRRYAQKQRLEAVGRLAGGVAHDFNNILTGVTGIVSLLLDDADPDHPWRSDLEDVLRDDGPCRRPDQAPSDLQSPGSARGGDPGSGARPQGDGSPLPQDDR